MSGDAAALRRLEDLETLRRMPQQYARAVDARDADALALLFDPAGEVEGTRGRQPVPEYVDTFRAPPTFATSMHVMADPLIELGPGTDEAVVDTYAVVHQLGRADGGADLTLGMRYVDAVVRTPEGWRIRHRRATVLWLR